MAASAAAAAMMTGGESNFTFWNMLRLPGEWVEYMASAHGNFT